MLDAQRVLSRDCQSLSIWSGGTNGVQTRGPPSWGVVGILPICCDSLDLGVKLDACLAIHRQVALERTSPTYNEQHASPEQKNQEAQKQKMTSQFD